ncbi:Clostridium phage phiCD119, XkdN [Moorella glycerini]|uniref:Phage XkdN-like protein n=1 Tax=Neomoorella stamsii TaxID=1266720 RepID=A0A9X7J1D5_9FIRM|nr:MULTISPECIES: hypothetical protein [Moorella]PRR69591.1 Phage XkdN-like protein [Moorella stamsii]CEP67885.1 Clostridium phage phiCD119, XkdN [Moorella glycerini]CEP68755.1 Clostridium phage phiCD119, XkdN [Moorella glycerini]
MSDEYRDELLAAENTILQDVGGVLEAMETITHYETFNVVRDGKKLFAFRVRGLTDEEMDNCRNAATRTVKNRRLGGLATPGEFNAAKYNSMLIYTATHPDDKKWLWDNKDLWRKADVTTGWMIVDKVLRRGEKEDVITLIEQLSGYNDEDRADTEETLKNS